MSKRITSITIEHGIIKLLVCEGTEILHHQVLMASPQFFWEGLVKDSTRVGGMIKGALQEMNGSPSRTVGAVPGFQTSLKVMEFPKARGLDPEVVIPREAARIMGVSQETSMLRWHRLDDVMDRSRWLVLSASRRAIQSYQDVASHSGVRIHALDMRPFALARAVNHSEAIVAWAAPDGAEVAIIKDSVPVAYQSQFWGAEPVESSVLVYRITEMLERSLEAYEQAGLDGPMPDSTPVYVCGSPVGLDEGIIAEVAENLGRPPGLLAPPFQYGRDFPVNDFIINLGLTLREN